MNSAHFRRHRRNSGRGRSSDGWTRRSDLRHYGDRQYRSCFDRQSPHLYDRHQV